MSHANEPKPDLVHTHDLPSRLPSKSSQPPIRTRTGTGTGPGKGSDLVMAPLPSEVLSHDTQAYYLKEYRQFWASGPATAFSVIAGSPLENVKVRMQSHHFPSAWAATKFVYHTEGVAGFWRGTSAPLLSITLTRVTNFVFYRRAKYELDRVIERMTGESPLQRVNTPGTYPNLGTLLCFGVSGMISGALMTPILTPFELVKNASQSAVLMSQESTSRGNGRPVDPKKKAASVSTIQAAKRIVELRGFGALWTGFRLHLARDVIGGAAYFGVYESIKQALGSYYGNDLKNNPWAIPVAGAICGVGSWSITYPLDTMKTRAQNSLLNVPSKVNTDAVLAAAAKSAARAGRWRGVEMLILRTALQNAIQMSAFEEVKVMIDNMKFDNGSTNLPTMKRERGRDEKIG